MKSDDPLSKKETVSAKDLSVLPLILPRRMNVQSELASWFGNYYEKLDIVYQQFKYEQRNYGEWRLGIFIGDWRGCTVLESIKELHSDRLIRHLQQQVY